MSIEFVKPTILDIPEMETLVKPYVEDGIILLRTSDEIANMIRSYTVAKQNNKIVGFGALHIYSTTLAEVRMLVVHQDMQNQKIGQKIVSSMIEEGKRLGIKEILTLTYNDHFFQKLGFHTIEKTEVPEHKVWEDCTKCKRFPECNEIALIIKL
ncbi:MAG: N-acetyltransferase [Campylobacterales bacterium]|nr:N-acetyltransferase [Campylobacterales bacterium]